MPGPQLVDSSGRWALDNRREFDSTPAAGSASAPGVLSQTGQEDAGDGPRASGRDALVRPCQKSPCDGWPGPRAFALAH